MRHVPHAILLGLLTATPVTATWADAIPVTVSDTGCTPNTLTAATGP